MNVATTLFGASRGVLSGLSLLASSSIVFAFLRAPALQTFPFKLIVLLCTSDAIASVGNLIGLFGFCQLEAALTQFGNVASFLWTFVIALNIYLVLVNNVAHVERLEKFYHALVWGTSLLLVSGVLALGHFGPVEPTLQDEVLWCWVGPSQPGIRLMVFYLPMTAVVLANACLYHHVTSSVCADEDEDGDVLTVKFDAKLRKKLFQYVGAFVFIRIWSVVNRIQTAVYPGEISLGLYFLHGAISSSSQGLVNAFVYGLSNRQVRVYYSECFYAAWHQVVSRGELSSSSPRASDMMLRERRQDSNESTQAAATRQIRRMTGGEQVVESLFAELVEGTHRGGGGGGGLHRFHDSLLDGEDDEAYWCEKGDVPSVLVV